MCAYSISESNELFFSILSMVLCKNRCVLNTIDLETGYMDVRGENSIIEDKCYRDIEMVFSEYTVY